MKPLCSPIDERSFIGCVIASFGETLDAYLLEPEAFFEPDYRRFYEMLLKMHKGKERICPESVVSKWEGIMVGQENIYDLCFYPSPQMAVQFYNTLCNWLAMRRARRLGERIVQDIEQKQDPTEFCRAIASEAASIMPSTACDNELGTACDALERRLGQIERGEKIKGYRAPLAAWNKAFGGICDGNLYAIAARPGLGKTALMEQMIADYIANDLPVAVFEKDMAPNMLIERIVCRAAKVPFYNFSNGFVTREDIASLRRFKDAINEAPLNLYNPTNLTPEKLSSIVRRDARSKGIKAVFLDHIQVLDVGKDKREGLTHASITIRQTATETNIPHIVLAHINRNGSKGRPTPEDIKEFDQLYGDCDGMAILWTDVDRATLKHGEFLPMKLYFAKNRNGALAEEPVLFDGRMMQFKDAAKDND
jgi:replicative DNA helicase